MQERYDEPNYDGPLNKSSFFPTSPNPGMASIADTLYTSESLYRSQEDTDIYRSVPSRHYESSRIHRPSTPLESDRISSGINYGGQLLERGDGMLSSRNHSDFYRASPIPNDSSLLMDDLSPLPIDRGAMSRSRRHSPMYPPPEMGEYSRNRNYDRYSPMVGDYRHPRNYGNDYYSDTNLSPYYRSPMPQDYGHYSPMPYDYYDSVEYYRRRTPIPEDFDLPFHHHTPPPPGYEERTMKRNLSFMNLDDDYPNDINRRFDAKSQECSSECEVTSELKSGEVNVCSSEENSSKRNTHEKDRSLTPMVPTDKAEEIAQLDASVKKEMEEKENEMSAIFASCNKNEEDPKKVNKQPRKQLRKQLRKPKKQESAPKPDDMNNENTKKSPCRDFENGVCSRGNACKYYHDPSKGKD